MRQVLSYGDEPHVLAAVFSLPLPHGAGEVRVFLALRYIYSIALRKVANDGQRRMLMEELLPKKHPLMEGQSTTKTPAVVHKCARTGVCCEAVVQAIAKTNVRGAFGLGSMLFVILMDAQQLKRSFSESPDT